jgi:hypothetical protein
LYHHDVREKRLGQIFRILLAYFAPVDLYRNTTFQDASSSRWSGPEEGMVGSPSPISFVQRSASMKWITRKHVNVDRVACPWLIRKFVDPQAEFIFVPEDQVFETARRIGASSYDCKGDELGHHGKKCSFDAFVEKYGLGEDPALMFLAKIVNGADTDNSLWHQPESAGLKAVAEGFRHLGFKDDMEQNKAEWIVYDSLYANCREMVRRGKPEDAFKE